jgi:hypothetical protein
MYTSLQYFSVHDKILYRDACLLTIDLNTKPSIFKGKLNEARFKEGGKEEKVNKDRNTCAERNSVKCNDISVIRYNVFS